MRLPVPLAAIILLSAAVAAGQEWTDQVRALRPRDRAAEVQAVLDSIDAKARESLASIHHSQTPEEARRALPGFRANLQNSLGFRRLAEPVNLHARTVGILRRHGYRIEKIVY